MTATTGLGDFAPAFYADGDVENACLWLQDNAGVDVVVLLCCCWLGTRREVFTDDGLATVLARSRAWSENLVKPVRSGRRWYRRQGDGFDETLYSRLKEAEISAEMAQTSMLENLLSTGRQVRAVAEPTPVADIAARNLNIYFGKAGIRIPDGGDARIGAILNALSLR